MKKSPNESHRNGIPMKMIDFLTAYGFIFWRHYRTVEKAQVLANNLRLELSRQILMRAGEGWIEYEESHEWHHARCRGWNGESSTCDCGAYEASWMLSGGWDIGSAKVAWKYRPASRPRAKVYPFAEGI
jgi:hypothetical protein